MSRRKGKIVWDKHIWVERKGKKKPQKFIKVSEFEEKTAKRMVKEFGITKREALKKVRMGLFINPDVILRILQTADKSIVGWRIPSKIEWEKRKKLKKIA